LQEEIKVEYHCFILSTSFSSSSWYLSKKACNTGVAKWIYCATYNKAAENTGHSLRSVLVKITTFPSTEKRVEKYMAFSGIFLTNFKVFGNVVKHCLEYLIYLLNQS